MFPQQPLVDIEGCITFVLFLIVSFLILGVLSYFGLIDSKKEAANLTLEDYLRFEFNKPDSNSNFIVRTGVEESGRMWLRILPLSTEGETKEFYVEGNVLIPKEVSPMAKIAPLSYKGQNEPQIKT